jgi:hypothetical protein
MESGSPENITLIRAQFENLMRASFEDAQRSLLTNSTNLTQPSLNTQSFSQQTPTAMNPELPRSTHLREAPSSGFLSGLNAPIPVTRVLTHPTSVPTTTNSAVSSSLLGARGHTTGFMGNPLSPSVQVPVSAGMPASTTQNPGFRVNLPHLHHMPKYNGKKTGIDALDWLANMDGIN